jgi:uncharacterized protein HemX
MREKAIARFVETHFEREELLDAEGQSLGVTVYRRRPASAIPVEPASDATQRRAGQCRLAGLLAIALGGLLIGLGSLIVFQQNEILAQQNAILTTQREVEAGRQQMQRLVASHLLGEKHPFQTDGQAQLLDILCSSSSERENR